MRYPVTKRLTVVFASMVLVTVISFEGWHKFRFEHFVGTGVHTDIVLSNSAVGTNDTYVARVWNLSGRTVDVEGCKLPGGYAGTGVLHHWDVQRWDPSRHDWSSLHGANTWLPKPLGGSDWQDYWSRCGGEITRIRPFTFRDLAWVYKDWVNPSDKIRMAIHTSVKLPLDRQSIIYTEIFSTRK